MKTLPLSELSKIDFTVSKISSILQRPSYHTLSTNSRLCNGFLYIEEGACAYHFRRQTLLLSPGSLIYLPRGSAHRLTVSETPIAFSRVNFTVYDPQGEEIVFSHEPLLITAQAGKHLTDSIHALTENFLASGNTVKSKALLCTVLDKSAEHCAEKTKSRIAPAIAYLEDRYSLETDCKQLASLCFLSPAQMYRLFKKEVGCTPLQYKNKLRIERACLLLRDRECTVGEIATLLGFDSVYYFSRIFKQYTGVSPSNY